MHSDYSTKTNRPPHVSESLLIVPVRYFAVLTSLLNSELTESGASQTNNDLIAFFPRTKATSSLVLLLFTPFLEESEVIFRDAYIGTLPTTLSPLHWQEFALFCVEWLPAGALVCLFLVKKLLDAPLSRCICFFLLLAAYATILAMQAVTSFVVVTELVLIKVFRTSLFIAHVASVRANVLCMVSLRTARFTHQRVTQESVVVPFLLRPLLWVVGDLAHLAGKLVLALFANEVRCVLSVDIV